MDLITQNINNMVSLWELGGKTTGELFKNENYSISIVRQSQWPNKLWFNRRPDAEMLKKVNEKWNLNGITLSVWGNDLLDQEKLMHSNDFELKNELTGMSMSLEQPLKHAGKLRFIKVDGPKLAKAWSHLFEIAFGYEIHAKTVELTMNEVDYYIGLDKFVLVGTAVLYQNQPEIAGIHSMGIIPEQRRKGYAEDLLVHVLNIAKQKGASYATLQASDMGKGLYEKTGFKNDFTIKNFIKHQQ